jgi:hypothetical protein
LKLSKSSGWSTVDPELFGVRIRCPVRQGGLTDVKAPLAGKPEINEGIRKSGKGVAKGKEYIEKIRKLVNLVRLRFFV